MSSITPKPASQPRTRTDASPTMLGTVLVTGASSGIGQATARTLAAAGFHVLAGVRDLDDALPLTEESDRIEPIELDVTDPVAIAAFAERASRLGNGLAALVNNAGTISVGAIEAVPASRWEETINVNVLGTINVTRAALPSLMRARGRVVNVSSPNGKLAMPMFGPYAVSKFALEAFNDTLRREVAHLGVRVICVSPGPTSTPIFDKGLAAATELMDASPADMRARYEPMIASAVKAAQETKSGGHTAQEAADVIARALQARRPKTRYPMGIENRLAATIARVVPDRAADRIVARFTTAKPKA
ncbi:MAG: SDR family oxidoreductase [Solirubrobacteraceae bacterium]|nr:SDR family oxidoreductase [Solirubrobacteraceae bacterium]